MSREPRSPIAADQAEHLAYLLKCRVQIDAALEWLGREPIRRKTIAEPMGMDFMLPRFVYLGGLYDIAARGTARSHAAAVPDPTGSPFDSTGCDEQLPILSGEIVIEMLTLARIRIMAQLAQYDISITEGRSSDATTDPYMQTR